jgi:hypothetical protein
MLLTTNFLTEEPSAPEMPIAHLCVNGLPIYKAGLDLVVIMFWYITGDVQAELYDTGFARKAIPNPHLYAGDEIKVVSAGEILYLTEKLVLNYQ